MFLDILAWSILGMVAMAVIGGIVWIIDDWESVLEFVASLIFAIAILWALVHLGWI